MKNVITRERLSEHHVCFSTASMLVVQAIVQGMCMSVVEIMVSRFDVWQDESTKKWGAVGLHSSSYSDRKLRRRGNNKWSENKKI